MARSLPLAMSQSFFNPSLAEPLHRFGNRRTSFRTEKPAHPAALVGDSVSLCQPLTGIWQQEAQFERKCCELLEPEGSGQAYWKLLLHLRYGQRAPPAQRPHRPIGLVLDQQRIKVSICKQVRGGRQPNEEERACCHRSHPNCIADSDKRDRGMIG
jgi:hypothetical protein